MIQGLKFAGGKQKEIDVGEFNENSLFQRVFVNNRVTIGFLFGLLLPILALPSRFPFLAQLPKAVIGAGPTLWSIALGLPAAVLGAGIRAWSSGVIVKNKELATCGPYALTRNPLYVGSFIMGLGITIMAGSPVLIAAVAVLFPLVYAGLVRKEEKYLLGVYGEEFLGYCARVPRFVPSLENWPPEPASYDIGRVLKKHKEWRAWLAVYAVTVFLLLCAALNRQVSP
ncbi:isoprenylcysteine carboxylmethyltransferase family protein [bacterium]|nr:MAG: isoprenylcysteine carboxylmethyltransferase family protein [bacterium]